MPLHYGAPARWLHWITALIIAGLLVAGTWIRFFNPADPLSHILYNMHESTGVTLFALVLVRLLVRWRNPPPPLPADVPTPIRLIAGATHFLLYALMLLQVATGFIGNAAGGIALVWYEVLPIPSPIGPDKALAGLLSNLHLAGAIGLVLLIGGHVTGALYHQFIRRDGLLRRML